MNRFVMIDDLPYLYDRGKLFTVRWDEKGFTVGAEVEKTPVPETVYSERSIMAKCAGRLDSITPNEEQPKRKRAAKAVAAE